MQLDDFARLIQQWSDQTGLPPEVLIGAAAFVVVLLVGLMLVLRRRGRKPPPLPPALAIDLAEIGDAGPPEDGAQISCYSLPVRLAVLVLAPAGRGEDVPDDVDRSAAIDQIIPDLPKVVAAHGTLVKIWPSQLSPRGFAHTFFANVKLPGDRGKGTPWCSIAGKFEADGEHYMAGMALCAERPNSLSQYIVEIPSEWLDLLRVERSARL